MAIVYLLTLRKSHDVPAPLLLRLGGGIASPDRDIRISIGEEWESVQVGIIESLVVWTLSVLFAELRFILPVGPQKFGYGGIWVVSDVPDQVSVRDWQLRKLKARHDR